MINKKNNIIMICVTQQKSCERLIRRGIQQHGINDELYVIHVVKDDWRYFSQMKESDALEYLFDVSKKYHADLIVLKSADIEKSLSDFAKEKNVNIIVMGESEEKLSQQNMIKRLKHKIKMNVSFDIVSKNERDY